MVSLQLWKKKCSETGSDRQHSAHIQKLLNKTLTRACSLRGLKAQNHVTLGLRVPHVISVAGKNATFRHRGLA